MGCIGLAFNLIVVFGFLPRFRQLFADMSGDRPLPIITGWTINGAWGFLVLGCLFLIAGLCIPPDRRARFYFCALVLALGAEIAFFVMAMMKPLIQFMSGQS